MSEITKEQEEKALETARTFHEAPGNPDAISYGMSVIDGQTKVFAFAGMLNPDQANDILKGEARAGASLITHSVEGYGVREDLRTSANLAKWGPRLSEWPIAKEVLMVRVETPDSVAMWQADDVDGAWGEWVKAEGFVAKEGGWYE